MLLKDKIALITGGSVDKGRAGALLFAREGAKVIIADAKDREGEKTTKEIREQGGEATFIHIDLTSVNEIEQMVKRTAGMYGRLDIFWHSAGAFFPGHIEVLNEEDYDKEMAVGLKAAVFGTKFVVPVMREAGRGCILYTCSTFGLRPSPYTPGYSLTHGIERAGLVMLMRCVTEPLAKYNIRVNCICCGPVETEQWKQRQAIQAKASGISTEEYSAAKKRRLPMNRTITEEEMANAAAFLASDKASAVTGVAFPVDGGFSAI
jgi:NAD(P)-dependent dehydrogenase (short-subunit alcohol dehydrogenase family)